MDFDAVDAIKKAESAIALRRAKHYKKRRSKLEPFRHEICKMYQMNATLHAIAEHLKSVHKQSVSESTILRYFHAIGVTRNG